MRNDGDVDAAVAAAAQAIEAEYYIPHLAHAPMEPPAATVRIADGKCEVWACVQSPQARARPAWRSGWACRRTTSRCNVTLLGGGFGRKSKPDFAVEAAILSKAMDGKPVKVTWTREDDLQHTYFHTVSVEHLEAGVDAQGKPVAWLHRSVAPTHHLDLRRRARSTRRALELGMGVINVPFAIPNIRIENPEAEAHTRIGWFRVGLEHPARVRGAVVRRRAGRGGRPRPEGLPAGGDRPAAPDQPGRPGGHLEPRRVAGAVPGGHRAAAPRGGDGRARGGLGPDAAQGPAASASPRTTAS